MTGINLYLCCKRAATPWTWYDAYKAKSETNKLYYARLPVPGIYAKHKNGKRYLVALKSIRKKDGGDLLVPSRKQLRMEEKFNNSPEQFVEGTLDKAGTASSIDSVSTISEAAIQAESSNSAEHQNMVPKSIVKDNIGANLTMIAHTVTSGSGRSINGSLDSKDRSSVGSQQKPAGLYSKLTNKAARTHGSFRGHISAVHLDMDGYRFLRRPAQIEYSNILERWLSASEIAERTVIVHMRKSPNCMERDPANCRHCKIVERKLFCLDDGFSWVIVARICHGLAKKRGRGRYRADEVTECMRRMTGEEESTHHEVLSNSQGSGRKDLASEASEPGEPDYMPVMRYLDAGDKTEARGRAVLRGERS